jgi:hypothetical protein
MTFSFFLAVSLSLIGLVSFSSSTNLPFFSFFEFLFFFRSVGDLRYISINPPLILLYMTPSHQSRDWTWLCKQHRSDCNVLCNAVCRTTRQSATPSQRRHRSIKWSIVYGALKQVSQRAYSHVTLELAPRQESVDHCFCNCFIVRLPELSTNAYVPVLDGCSYWAAVRKERSKHRFITHWLGCMNELRL